MKLLGKAQLGIIFVGLGLPVIYYFYRDRIY